MSEAGLKRAEGFSDANTSSFSLNGNASWESIPSNKNHSVQHMLSTSPVKTTCQHNRKTVINCCTPNMMRLSKNVWKTEFVKLCMAFDSDTSATPVQYILRSTDCSGTKLHTFLQNYA